jgi:hypothetical protein
MNELFGRHIVDNRRLFFQNEYFLDRISNFPQWIEVLDNLIINKERIRFESKQLFDKDLHIEKGFIYKGAFCHPAYWKNDFVNIVGYIQDLLKQYLGSNFQSNVTNNVLNIHIRRGDYESDRKTRLFHGLLDSTYFREALELINKLDEYEQVQVFSDSLEAANSVLCWLGPERKNVRIVNEKNPIKLLSLMSECSSFIGSHSTLSWWAAYLGPEKLRVLPSKWFVNDKADLNPLNSFFLKDTHLVQNNLLVSENPLQFS